MLNNAQKKVIQELLNQFIGNYPSQLQAVKALKNVSEATVISIRRGEFEKIADKMWRNLGEQLGYDSKGEWLAVETGNYRILQDCFTDSQMYGNVFAVAAQAGSGKSYTANQFRLNNAHVYVLTCAEYMNQKVFLQKLLEQMGRPVDGNVSELMDRITSTLRKIEKPLIILDEFDKLRDQTLYFFITLYNELKGKCGIVLMATEFLAKRIERGRALNRKGYAEIYSRIGHKFIGLHPTTQEEVAQICRTNGVEDLQMIRTIFNSYEGDLRRLERLVHKYRVTQDKNDTQNALKNTQDESEQ